MKMRLGLGRTPGRSLALLLALGVAAIGSARALDPAKAFSQYVQSSWTYQNGFTARSVMGIAQTEDGFLWLATEQGLVRYDGKTMYTFDERNSPELGDRFIRSLSADADGSLWIGTTSGIAHYKNGRFRSYRNETHSHVDIFDISADQDGGVWFSSDQGLHHFSPQDGSRVYTTADGLPGNEITGLSRSADDTLWIGTTKGLASLKNGQIGAYTDWDGFRKSDVNAVTVGAHDVVWIGTKNGMLGRWANGKITTWPDRGVTRGGTIESMHEDRDGNLWLAVRKVGLVRLRGREIAAFTKSDKLPGNDPDWIFEDRENSLWIGWSGAGLSMLRDAKFTSFGKPEGLSSDAVSSVTGAEDGGLWIGTGDAGVNHLHAGKVKFIDRSNGLAEDDVLGLLQQRDRTLWVGSENGYLTRIRDRRSKTYKVSSEFVPGVPAIVEDQTGSVWFGFDMPRGLAHLRNGHFQPTSMPGRANALSVAPDGALWVASYGTGLVCFRNGAFRIYTEKDGLPSLALTSVYADHEGIVWAGTTLSGIVRWKDDKITRYSIPQGLFDSEVAGIIEDDTGYLWMSGSRGIWRIRKQEFDDYAAGRIPALHSDSYGYSDGMRSTQTDFRAQPAIWKSADGRLWFANGGGLAMVDPKHILSNTVAPHVLIESLVLQGHPIPLAKGTNAPPPENGNVEIRFTSPSFVAPEKMRFRYRLQGVDSDWINADSSHIAKYDHLGPGRYHFEVEAANNDSVWSTNVANVDFKFSAHYYQTLWFKAAAGCCLALAVWSVYVVRVRYLVRRTRLLEDTVLRRTSEVQAALNAAEIVKELLREQATRDSLTGLLNRRAIFEIFDRELEQCRKQGVPFCVLMVDADHFKAVNDTFGHLAGDSVIQFISEQLTSGLRENDYVGRYGGEELLVLLPGCTLEIGLMRAEKLRHSIEESSLIYKDKEIRVTCSFGLSQSSDMISSTEIIRMADEALYSAKKAGRNCVRYNAPVAISEDGSANERIETDTASAIFSIG